MFCPKCRAEYTAGVRICADCGIELVNELPEETEQETKVNDINDLPLNEFEELYLANTPVVNHRR
jgi:uncharacterized Zn ribbon protein